MTNTPEPPSHRENVGQCFTPAGPHPHSLRCLALFVGLLALAVLTSANSMIHMQCASVPSHHHLVSTLFLPMSMLSATLVDRNPYHDVLRHVTRSHILSVFSWSCPSSPGSASFCHCVLGSLCSLTFWRAPPHHL